jgi:hypothetical protein
MRGPWDVDVIIADIVAGLRPKLPPYAAAATPGGGVAGLTVQALVAALGSRARSGAGRARPPSDADVVHRVTLSGERNLPLFVGFSFKELRDPKHI